jgi:hypothetical protein
MKLFSLFFILCTLYYLFNRKHLLSKTVDRVYKYKYKVYLDIIYFLSDFLYLVWVVVMIFVSFKLSILLILIIFLRWIFLDPFKDKQDMTYIVLKLLVLFSILIS